MWVVRQRQWKKEGTLSAERIARLDALGFAWVMRDPPWESIFAALERYKHTKGSSNVPHSFRGDGPIHLGNWLTRQRQAFKSGNLGLEKIKRLKALGVDFRSSERTPLDV